MLKQQREKIDGRTQKRKSPEMYRQEFETRVGMEYELLSEYVKSSQKVRIKHQTCGTEFDVLPSTFIRKPACRQCQDKNRRLEPTAYKERFEQKLGHSFELLGEYSRYVEPVDVRHKPCGHVFKMLPGKIITNLQCPSCKKIEYNETTVLKKLQEEAFKEYEVTYDVYQEGEEVQIKHKVCGCRFKEYIGVFIKKPECPDCGKDYINDESFKAKMIRTYGDKYKILNRFRGYQHPLCVQHNDENCMKYSYPYATNFSAGGYRCPHCEKLK